VCVCVWVCVCGVCVVCVWCVCVCVGVCAYMSLCVSLPQYLLKNLTYFIGQALPVHTRHATTTSALKNHCTAVIQIP